MRLAIASFLALGVAAVLAAQTPANPQQPTFRAGINLVRVDVYPTLRGQAVTDLQKDEFDLLEDGVPQRLETFERVVIRAPGPEVERSEPTSVRASDDAAGDPRNRLFVLFLDTYHTRQDRFMTTTYGTARQQQARPAPRPADAGRITRALSSFLQRLIGPDDLVALMTPEMPVKGLTFTRRPASIQEFLETTPWQRKDTVEDFDEREQMYRLCYGPDSETTTEMIVRRRERMVLTALRGLVTHLQSLREERKAILLVSEGWTLFRPAQIGAGIVAQPPRIGIAGGKPTIGDPRDVAQREQCERDRQILSAIDDERDFRELLQIANRANATFYPIDPAGLEAAVSVAGWDAINRRQSPLQSLAAETDGIAVINTNDVNTGLKRITDDLSSYYLLGYYSTNAKADGTFRKITVRVKRPGVAVRARPGYLAPTEADLKAYAAANAPPPDPGALALQSALNVLDRGRPDRVLLLRGAWTWPAPAQAARDAVLVVVAELDPAAARQPGWQEGGELSASILDLDGRTLASASGKLSAAARSCLIRFADVPLAPGEYLARVKAQWSVLTTTEQVRISVPDGSPGAATVLGQPIVFRRGPYTGAGFQPTADLRFRRAERIRVDMPLAGSVEAVAAQLLDRKGQPLPVPVTTEQREEEGRRFVAAELALAPLAPGDYLIEMSVRRGDRTDKVLTAFRIVP
jgi:VWFA-related protein